MNNLTTEIKMTSLDLVELTGKRHDNIMADIRKEIDSLGKEIAELIFKAGSYLDKNNQSRPCYVFGKKGAMQLALKYEAKVRFRVIERLEELENKNKEQSLNISKLSPELQMFQNMFNAVAKVELENAELKGNVEKVSTEIQNIRDIVILEPDADWRKFINSTINNVARKSGGDKKYEEIRTKSYERLNNRAECNVYTRLTNLQKRLKENGATKTKINTACLLDVIEDDVMIKEIYTNIVKQIAIKCNV